jgi:hypothetical protein
MKVLLGAAFATLLLATGAAAQTGGDASASVCAPPPASPLLPDATSATREQMDAANTAYTAWALAYRNNLVCRRDEAEALHERWLARVSEHNALADALNAQHTAWEAEVAEFNERAPRRPGSRN